MRQLTLALLVLAVAFAKDKPVYPNHGTVVAMRTDRATSSTGVYTDPYGKTHGGVVGTRKIPVFTIRTENIDYEIEGRRDLSVEQEVRFRIDNRRIYVQNGDKEDRYDIVGEEKR